MDRHRSGEVVPRGGAPFRKQVGADDVLGLEPHMRKRSRFIPDPQPTSSTRRGSKPPGRSPTTRSRIAVSLCWSARKASLRWAPYRESDASPRRALARLDLVELVVPVHVTRVRSWRRSRAAGRGQVRVGRRGPAVTPGRSSGERSAYSAWSAWMTAASTRFARRYGSSPSAASSVGVHRVVHERGRPAGPQRGTSRRRPRTPSP